MHRSKASPRKSTTLRKQTTSTSSSVSKQLSSVSSRLSNLSSLSSPSFVSSRSISTSNSIRSRSIVPQQRTSQGMLQNTSKPSIFSSLLESSPFTLPQRFSTTSKKWNKKSKVAQKNDFKRKVIQNRYHGATRYMALPKMNSELFARLPRPLYIESESLNLMVPAPQFERFATPGEFKTAKKAALPPY